MGSSFPDASSLSTQSPFYYYYCPTSNLAPFGADIIKSVFEGSFSLRDLHIF
jgi:hypothetical protein